MNESKQDRQGLYMMVMIIGSIVLIIALAESWILKPKRSHVDVECYGGRWQECFPSDESVIDHELYELENRYYHEPLP